MSLTSNAINHAKQIEDLLKHTKIDACFTSDQSEGVLLAERILSEHHSHISPKVEKRLNIQVRSFVSSFVQGSPLSLFIRLYIKVSCF